MKHNFEIITYVGAEPLSFGMTESQVESSFGSPLATMLNNLGEKNAQYDTFSVRYSLPSGTLLEIGFSVNAKVMIHGIDVFSEKDAFQRLLQDDSCPYEYFGFVILLDLGITLTGFHDNDSSQRAVTAFIRGRWDHLKGKFKELRVF